VLDFIEISILWTDFRKVLKYQNVMKIRPVEGELFAHRRKEGRTGRYDVANSRFSQYCERA
jgi:hypothetical protein